MAMPADIVFVRHGESEANVINNDQKHGDGTLWTPEYHGRHDSEMRLSVDGSQQAKITGEWLRSEFPEGFDRNYVSPHTRAMETAGQLALNPDNGWMMNDLIRERDWGEFGKTKAEERLEKYQASLEQQHQNAWYWQPQGGESLATGVRLRYERVQETFHRELAEKKVILVTHGEFMWVARFVIERMTVPQWLELEEDPTRKIRNTMVLHYTRRNPHSPDDTELSPRVNWMRAVCPWDESKSLNGGEWQEVKRKTYSDSELLSFVEQKEPLLPR